MNLSFHSLFYEPLFNLLIFLYNTVPGHDFGVAIILVTVIIKILLIPSSNSAIKSQKEMADLQPKIKEIQKKYKDDREKQGLAMMELYKENKINPFGGFLSLIIQIPILIALYSVFLDGFNPEKLIGLYHFVVNPGIVNPSFLGLIDLSKSSIILAILASLLQYFQTKMMMPVIKNKEKKDDFLSLLNQQMVYMAPFMTLLIGLKFPAGLTLYWTTITLFAIIQQYFVIGKKKKKIEEN